MEIYKMILEFKINNKILKKWKRIMKECFTWQHKNQNNNKLFQGLKESLISLAMIK